MKKIIIGGCACLAGIGIGVGTYLFETAPSTHLPSKTETPQQQESPPGNGDTLQTVESNGPVGYALTDELHITYDEGRHWSRVPIGIEALFAGEYNGQENELIEQSFFLSEDLTAFLYVEGADDQRVKLLYSLEQGHTWNDTDIGGMIAPRFRKVGFLNEDDGYVVYTGERTMSSEATKVYMTHDSGETWTEVSHPDHYRLLYDGNFIDEKTGFLSYGILNPEEPDLYVTQDGGQSWVPARIEIPDEYHLIFTTAETPYVEGNDLVLLVNQGSSGDYKGGKVKGKFISKDNGLSWSFQKEVDADE
ncbi:WD40/YVTN/BNR-like repeat-containing protein [Rossellomorea marisflavi]|uniref:WD40/YVTN/BNR-like repeat-containing protein n=1 Tax=Rossellomorea marisflavi TaxID=189381 RepID=UPI003457FC2D